MIFELLEGQSLLYTGEVAGSCHKSFQIYTRVLFICVGINTCHRKFVYCMDHVYSTINGNFKVEILTTFGSTAVSLRV